MMRPPARPLPNSSGFTLAEIVIVIVITGIVAVMLGTIILGPIKGFESQARRADLVDIAESALRRMQRDIRHALPNSARIRTPGGTVGDVSCPANHAQCVIEILSTVDGGRYRADPPGNRLQFNGADTTFNYIGVLTNAANIAANQWLVINNQTVNGASFNAYNCPLAGASHNCVRLASLDVPTSTITLANAFSPTTPALASAQQRFYVVRTPVTYLCNTATGTLTRYETYSINPNHASRDTDAQLVAAGNPTTTVGLVANLVSSCRFTYQAGTSARAGVVTLDLTVQDATAGEQVRLLHQVHVYNTP